MLPATTGGCRARDAVDAVPCSRRRRHSWSPRSVSPRGKTISPARVLTGTAAAGPVRRTANNRLANALIRALRTKWRRRRSGRLRGRFSSGRPSRAVDGPGHAGERPWGREGLGPGSISGQVFAVREGGWLARDLERRDKRQGVNRPGGGPIALAAVSPLRRGSPEGPTDGWLSRGSSAGEGAA
jgi:hypothetical protein